MRTRLVQTSSSVAAPLGGETPWKTVRVLPQQTVLEAATLEFPTVKAPTTFLVQWLESSGRVAGTTQVRVCPPDLLAELKPDLHEDGELGVLDPANALKPALRQSGVRFLDLGETELKDFTGKLAILGPYTTKTEMRPGLAEQVKSLAQRKVAVLWLQPPPTRPDHFAPSFFSAVTR